jgi:formylglycine-generating enzyme required for sulfatase activity
MIRVPAGSAVLGSSPEEILRAAASCASEPLGHRCSERTFANELGRRSTFQPAFWLDRVEVTVRAYERCVVAGQCLAPVWGAARFDMPDYPVTFVTHHDAEAYCKFRGARLPSEAEFERAARGSAGRTYPWGEIYNTRVANHGRFALVANDASDGYAELAPVGSFPAGRTPDGILDLAGNVAEWTADAYRERYADPVPLANEASRRVVRGGSWRRGAAWLRGAAREGVAPDTRRPDIGFRCAQNAGHPENDHS